MEENKKNKQPVGCCYKFCKRWRPVPRLLGAGPAPSVALQKPSAPVPPGCSRCRRRVRVGGAEGLEQQLDLDCCERWSPHTFGIAGAVKGFRGGSSLTPYGPSRYFPQLVHSLFLHKGSRRGAVWSCFCSG